MPIVFNCPTCREQLTLSDAAAGRRGKCPHCKGEIVVPAAGSAAAPPAPPPLPGPAPAGHAAAASSAPALEIPAAAAAPAASPVMVAAASAPPPPFAPPLQPGGWADVDVAAPRGHFRAGHGQPHRGVMVMVLGIISIVVGVLSYFVFCCPFVGLPVGLIGLGLSIGSAVMGGMDLKKINAGAMDAEGKPMTLAGFICGIVGSVVVAPSLVLSGFMTIMMIIGAATSPTTRSKTPYRPMPTAPSPNFPE
jgi:hypothetical protein